MAATIKCDTLQNASSATANVTLDASGNATAGNNLTITNNLTVTGQTIPSSSFKRNRIINGNMAVSQRATSFSSPASGSYTLDRWLIGWSGAAPATVAQVSGPTGFRNALQITGAASNTSVNILQRIESYNCSDLSGKTITIQANISASASQTVAWYLYYANSQDTFSSVTTISNGTWSVTSTATTFTATVTGLPSGATNGLQLQIIPNNIGAFTSGTISITGVQLEVGSAATPYEVQIYSDQLAQCQRYYYNGTFATAGTTSTTQCNGQFIFPVTMRSSPTVAAYPSGTYTITAFGTGDFTSTSPGGVSVASSVNGAKVDFGGFTGLTASRPAVLWSIPGVGIPFSSEL